MIRPNDPITAAVTQSKFKIEWAKNHIDRVEHIVKALISANADAVRVQDDPEAKVSKVIIGPKHALPAQLALHIGDAVHNLNGVMDFLWSGLARACAPNLASKVTFPRHQTRDNLCAEINNAGGHSAAIYQTFPQAKGFVLDEVGAYKRPDDPSFIWSLNKLDNVNKHRLLITTAHVLSFDQGLEFTGSDGGRIVFSSDASIKTQGKPMTLRLTYPVKLSNNPKATVSVILNEPEWFSPQPVVESLVNFTDAATKVVETFEKTFL